MLERDGAAVAAAELPPAERRDPAELVAELAEAKSLVSVEPEARALLGLKERSRCACGRPVVADEKCRTCLAMRRTQAKTRAVATCPCGAGPVEVVDVGGYPLQRTHCTACLAGQAEAERARGAELEAAHQEHVRLDRLHHVARYLSAAGVPLAEFTRGGHPVLPTFANFDPDPDAEALEAARHFAAAVRHGQRRRLYLFSEREGERIATGAGKSHLLAAAAHHLVTDPGFPARGVRWLFMPALHDVGMAVVRRRDGQQALLDLVAPAFGARLVVLDDFGNHAWPEWLTTLLLTLLDRLGDAAVGITSNFTWDDHLSRDPTERVASLLSRLSDGALTPPPLQGRDRRLDAW